MDILWRIVGTLALVALNAYFVAAEFAAVGARLTRLETLAEESFFARLALRVKQRLDLYLSTCQLGVTIASLGLGAVTEPAVAKVLEPILSLFAIPVQEQHATAFLVAFFLSTSLHIVVGEQAPKTWAILSPDRLLPVLAGPLVVFTYIFFPLIWLLNRATTSVLKLSGVRVRWGHTAALPHTADELRALLADAIAAGTISKGHSKILTSAFDFSQIKVRQIMVPRTQVAFLTLDQPLGEILRTVQKSAYTRLPLCDGDIDHVVGLIHMKDLFNHLKLIPGRLRFLDERTPEGEAIAVASGAPGSAVHVIGSGDIDLRQIKRDILFVPELISAPQVLRQFQSSHIHMAVAVDEYGSTQGVVTLEDVLEEIVGEIEDEFDVSSPPAFTAEGESFRVGGQYPIHQLREKLPDAEIESSGDVDTLGGYLTQKLGRWPRPGDTVELGRYVARVISVHQRRVGQVMITPLPKRIEDGE